MKTDRHSPATNRRSAPPVLVGVPQLEDRSYLAYLRPTPRPFLHFCSGHFPAETLTQPHTHSCIALHGCLEGPLNLCSPAGEVSLDAGVFYLIGPGVRHWWRNDGAHTAATLSLLLDAERPGRWPAGTGAERVFRELQSQVRGLIRLTTSGDRELHRTFWQAADLLMSERPCEPLTVAGVLLTLLGQINQRIAGESEEPLSNHDAAQQIRRMLLARVRDTLSISQIASEVGTSPTRSKELFRQAFGCGIMTYFNRLKIWQAKRLLNDGSLSVEQVSQQLGFSSPSYFSRAFLKYTGVTPTTYRKGNRDAR